MIPAILRAVDNLTSWAAARVISLDRERAVYRVGALALEVHALRVERERARDRERALTDRMDRAYDRAARYELDKRAAIHAARNWKALAKRLREEKRAQARLDGDRSLDAGTLGEPR
jgi:hypothetical protein